MKRADGFTLLETLVALAIVAIALSAALRALGGTAQSTAALRDHMLADWVAQNRLAELRARALWPDTGRSEGSAEQGRRRFVWRQTVSATPNALFRRVEVQVYDEAGSRPLAGFTGFVARPPR